jgi:hypothetical protein
VYWDTEVVVENCAALNGVVGASGDEAAAGVHRVIGRKDELAQMKKNIANAEMTCISAPAADVGDDGHDGTAVSLPLEEGALTALGWDFGTVWTMESGYPVLRWQQ